MAEKKEKIKLYLVVGLMVAAAAVAYFRFFHKSGTGPPPVSVASPVGPVRVPVAQAAPQPKEVKKTPVRQEPLRAELRDIFAPLAQPTPELEQLVEEAQPIPELPPGLTLQGTILAGKKSIAVINERFLRLGDAVGEYRVARIDRNGVVLRAGEVEVVLDVSGLAAQ